MPKAIALLCHAIHKPRGTMNIRARPLIYKALLDVFIGDIKPGSIVLTKDYVHVVTRWAGGSRVFIPQDIQIELLIIASEHDNTKRGDQGYFLEFRNGKVTDEWKRVKCH